MPEVQLHNPPPSKSRETSICVSLVLREIDAVRLDILSAIQFEQSTIVPVSLVVNGLLMMGAFVNFVNKAMKINLTNLTRLIYHRLNQSFKRISLMQPNKYRKLVSQEASRDVSPKCVQDELAEPAVTWWDRSNTANLTSVAALARLGGT